MPVWPFLTIALLKTQSREPKAYQVRTEQRHCPRNHEGLHQLNQYRPRTGVQLVANSYAKSAYYGQSCSSSHIWASAAKSFKSITGIASPS